MKKYNYKKLWLACLASLAGLTLTSQAQEIPPAPANVVSNYYTANYNVPVPVLDFTTTDVVFEITGAVGKIWDVNLQTMITHTASSDLEIYLTSPSGKKVAIITDSIANVDSFNGTWWDDQATINALDATYPPNGVVPTLQPEGAMAAFDGENPNGTWTLTVIDNANNDQGSLDSAKLDIATYVGKPTFVTKTYTNSVSTPIPDNASIDSTLSVSNQPYRVSEVKVFTKIPHTFPDDLVVTLTSPAGTQSTLVSTRGDIGMDNVFNGTLWSDNAAETVTAPYANNVVKTELVPEGALGAFKGENPNGTWTLTLADNNVGEAGNLDNWWIEITTCSGGVNDVNGDGYTDIIGKKRKEIRVLSQQAGQTANEAVSYGQLPAGSFKVVGSYMANNDETSDLIVQLGPTIMYLATSNGTFSTTPVIFPGVFNEVDHPRYKVHATGDINSDGYTDFVIMRRKQIGVILGGFNNQYTFKTITEQSQNGKVVGVVGTNLISQRGRRIYRIPINSDGTNTVTIGGEAVALTENAPGKVVGVSEMDGKDGQEILIQRRKRITYGTWDSGNYTTELWTDQGKPREDRLGKVVAPQ